MSESAWDYAKKRAAESGGMFLSLKNDGDKTVGVFVGDPKVVDLYYDKKTEKYEPYTEEHKAKGLQPSPRFMMNFWVRSERVCRIWEFNGQTFGDVIAAKEKYTFDTFAFEICRHGKAKDTKTSYTVLPETKEPLTAEEKTLIAAAVQHDLEKAKAGDAASDMESHDKKSAAAGGKTNGTAAGNGAPAPAPGADLVDLETKNALVLRLKQHPKDKVDAFLGHFKIKKLSELKKSEAAAASAMLDGFEGKNAPAAAAAATDDPFA